MCKYVVGKKYNFTGRSICENCGLVARQVIGDGTFIGHDNNYDVFAITPNACPWCGKMGTTIEQPCSDPIPVGAVELERVRNGDV